ncbi:MAG: hypothetical protein ACLFQP_03580 [Halothece sp.]
MDKTLANLETKTRQNLTRIIKVEKEIEQLKSDAAQWRELKAIREKIKISPMTIAVGLVLIKTFLMTPSPNSSPTSVDNLDAIYDVLGEVNKVLDDGQTK